jgi:hypothetical protein
MGCKTPGFQHLLDNRLADGGEINRLKSRPRFTPRKISDTHIRVEAE